jgi:hypothetical protein
MGNYMGNYMVNKIHWSAILLILGLVACTSDPGTGPVEVKWDRDTCERCRMVLSDRLHAAQVRGGPAGEKSRVYKFDDIGGAILWLEGQAWKDNPATEIWVNDHRDGRWIDAYAAVYIAGQITPMDFGFGAQDEAVDGGVDFEAMRDGVLNKSRRPGSGSMPAMEHIHDHN